MNFQEEKEEPSVENRRLSRLRGETDAQLANRGRRGSGATTTSRSSSPVASGDEQEPDQNTRSSRSRKKSGRTTAHESESMPGSPDNADNTSDYPLDISEWPKSGLGIVQEMKNHKLAPYLSSHLQQEDHAECVLRNMDLAAIGKSIESKNTKTPIELSHDLCHFFLNVAMSSNSESQVWTIPIVSWSLNSTFRFQIYETALAMYKDCVSSFDDTFVMPTSTRSTRDKRDSSASGTSTPDERKKRTAAEATPSSSKRRKR